MRRAEEANPVRAEDRFGLPQLNGEEDYITSEILRLPPCFSSNGGQQTCKRGIASRENCSDLRRLRALFTSIAITSMLDVRELSSVQKKTLCS